jgi:hypothetical protein
VVYVLIIIPYFVGSILFSPLLRVGFKVDEVELYGSEELAAAASYGLIGAMILYYVLSRQPVITKVRSTQTVKTLLKIVGFILAVFLLLELVMSIAISGW